MANIKLFWMFFYVLSTRSFHMNNRVGLPMSINAVRSVSKQIHTKNKHKQTTQTHYMSFKMKKEESRQDYKHAQKIQQNYSPKGPNQQTYVKYLNDPTTDIVLGVGPAGTGKTLFACYTAIQELKKGNIQKIIITRPIVSVDQEELGFLPGDINNKMDPWTRPIFDIFLDFFNQQEINNMVFNKIIEIAPLAYMRGRTFKNAFIIADEMQNSSPNQMLMMTTRIGTGTKMVITGDLKQSDRMEENGLMDFITKYKVYDALKNETHQPVNTTEPSKNGIQLVELTKEDIERSPIVAKILDMYQTKTATSLSSPFRKNKMEQYNQSYANDCAMIPKYQL